MLAEIDFENIPYFVNFENKRRDGMANGNHIYRDWRELFVFSSISLDQLNCLEVKEILFFYKLEC